MYLVSPLRYRVPIDKSIDKLYRQAMKDTMISLFSQRVLFVLLIYICLKLYKIIQERREINLSTDNKEVAKDLQSSEILI